jgi:poly-gamma-glutamate system protein
MAPVSWVVPRVSLRRLAAVSLAVLLAAAIAERAVTGDREERRVRASRVMAAGLAAIREARLAQGVPFSPDDPGKTGIVGEEMSPLVTTLGSLPAKRHSADPAFAALAVDLLVRAGVREGDVIAVGFSGSLPGLNLAVLSAASALGLDPIIISSVGASQWGATDPAFTWLDMERALGKRAVVPFRSAAVAVGGGSQDSFLLEEGEALAREAIRRSGLPQVAGATQPEIVARRMEIYLARAGRRPIAAFVNVGGASANIGLCDESRIPPGVVTRLPRCMGDQQGVLHRFAAGEIPVIHLLQVNRLGRRYGMAGKVRSG